MEIQNYKDSNTQSKGLGLESWRSDRVFDPPTNYGEFGDCLGSGFCLTCLESIFRLTCLICLK